jgi:type III secretory pathway component EscR
MDKSNNSSLVALIAAATVVIALFISAPIMLGMYMDTNKNNYVVESKSKQVDIKIEKLDDMIKYNEKLLKELEKNNKENYVR